MTLAWAKWAREQPALLALPDGTARRLPPGAKSVLLRLADRARAAGVCWPEVALTAADCGMSRATVQRHLALLEELGLIRRVAWFHRDGGQASNWYWMGASWEAVSMGEIPERGRPLGARGRARLREMAASFGLGDLAGAEPRWGRGGGERWAAAPAVAASQAALPLLPETEAPPVADCDTGGLRMRRGGPQNEAGGVAKRGAGGLKLRPITKREPKGEPKREPKGEPAAPPQGFLPLLTLMGPGQTLAGGDGPAPAGAPPAEPSEPSRARERPPGWWLPPLAGRCRACRGDLRRRRSHDGVCEYCCTATGPDAQEEEAGSG